MAEHRRANSITLLKNLKLAQSLIEQKKTFTFLIQGGA